MEIKLGMELGMARAIRFGAELIIGLAMGLGLRAAKGHGNGFEESLGIGLGTNTELRLCMWLRVGIVIDVCDFAINNHYSSVEENTCRCSGRTVCIQSWKKLCLNIY